MTDKSLHTTHSSQNISSVISRFESVVRFFLGDYQKVTPLLVAVSGGADSMAMLASLCAVIPKEQLYCMHVEHGLRPAHESCGDAEFVRIFCEANKIECRIAAIPPGKIAGMAKKKKIGLAAAARHYRHKALFRLAAQLGKDTVILLAHTKDDLLETALMRVLRGVGPAGLAAMPFKRGRIIRPLLSFTRADIIEYLNEKKVSWREDASNTDTNYLRNRTRHKLIPLLNDLFPSWKTGVNAMAQTQALAADFIAQEAKTRIRWNGYEKASRQGAKKQRTPSKKKSLIYTDENEFFKQPQILREESIYQALNTLFPQRALREKNRVKSIKRSVIRRFCEGTVNAADLGSVRLKRENGQILLFLAQKEFFERGVSRLIKDPSLGNNL